MTDSNHAANRTLGLQAEWEMWPLWYSSDDDFPESYDFEEITAIVPLSDELCEAIEAWDERFQAIYDKESPQDSAFASEDDEAAFIAEGDVLARRIRREAPADVIVQYAPLNGSGWVVVDPE
jgi:hypothetical protein